MHRDDYDIVGFRSMHNPQHPVAVIGDSFVGSRALRLPRIGFDKSGEFTVFNPTEGNAARVDGFLRVLG